MKVYKYPLINGIDDCSILSLPYESNIIHFDYKDGNFNIWAEVNCNTTKPREDWYFRIIGTGDSVPDYYEYLHFNTIIVDDYVWHLYIYREDRDIDY